MARIPSRTVVPTADRMAIRDIDPAAARAEAAAAPRAATAATRAVTISTCRLERSPVAHQVVKCSQLSMIGQ
jgi:hypothetical protein